MQCLCRRRLDSALPYRRTKKEEAREKATRLSPISAPYQKKNGSYARKATGEETVVLFSSKFLGEIKAYLLGLTRADCCVIVQSEATLCNCLTFLADKPSVIKYVASLIQMYFDFNDRNQRHHLAPEMRYADRIMR